MRRLKLRRERDAYRSPREIALRNAAEELGVSVGDYYPEDIDLRDPDPAVPLPSERLDASREELLVYIERLAATKKRGRRSRRYVVLGMAMLGLVVAGLSVASPWERPHESGRKHLSPSEWLTRLPPGVPRGPLPLGGTSVEMKLRQGRQAIVSVAFVDGRGDVCRKVLYEANGVAEGRSGGGCLSTGLLASELLRTHAFATSVSTEKGAVLLHGYAKADITAIVARGLDRGIDVAISPVWAPGSGTRGPRMRAFFARVPVARRVDILKEVHRVRLLAVFPNRHVVPIRSASGDEEPPPKSGFVDPISR